MQNRPMAYNFLQCDFLLQQLLHTLPLVIFSFLSREVLQGKSVNRSSRKGPSLDFFVFSCFRYPRYQRITGHMPNCLKIFCLQLRLYGPVRDVPYFGIPKNMFVFLVIMYKSGPFLKNDSIVQVWTIFFSRKTCQTQGT